MNLPPFDFRRTFHSRELSPFPMIEAFGFHGANRAKHTTPHRHGGIEILYFTRGRARFYVDGRLYPLRSGEGLITCPWQLHWSEFNFLQPCRAFWLVIKPQTFSHRGPLRLGTWSLLPDGKAEKIGRLIVANTGPVLNGLGELEGNFETLYTELTRRPWGYRQRVHLLLTEALLLLGRRIAEHPIKPAAHAEPEEWIRRLIKKISDHPDAKWTTRTMSAGLGVNAAQFNQKLKHDTGLSPHEFLIHHRIEAAKERLAQGRTFVDTALACGFSSQQHFSAVFKKQTGYSPRDYVRLAP